MTRSRPWPQRWTRLAQALFLLFALAALGLMAHLFEANLGLYQAIFAFWGVDVTFTPYRPFLDLSDLFSAARCHAAGVDVFTANTCDPLHRPHGYPLAVGAWGPLMPDESYTRPAGLMVSAAFVTAMVLILRPATSVEALVCFLALISPSTAYVLERGNLDTIVFILAVCAASLAALPRIRFTAYLPVTLAALLKFYPIVALANVLSERGRKAGIAAAAGLLVFSLYLLGAGPDLHKMLQHVAKVSCFCDAFGSVNLLRYAVVAFRKAPEPFDHLVPFGLYAILVVVVFASAAMRQARVIVLERRTPGDEMRFSLFFMAGCMVVFAFFAGTNIAYRQVLLVLLIPYLLQLHRQQVGDAGKAHALVLAVLLVVLLWSEFLRAHLPSETWKMRYVILLREPSWWIAMLLLLSILWAQLESFPVVQSVRKRADRLFEPFGQA